RRDDPERARGPAEPGDRDERAGDDTGAAPGPNARRARAEPPVESDALGGTQPRGAPRVPRGAPSVGGMGAMSGPPSSNWRLLVAEPCDGATNMAIDEALWRGRHAGTSPPTVRFFAWDPPTVSVGYGQPLDRHVDVAACRRLGVGLVRRPTGGSAIYHDGPERELTYCVTATADDLGV